MTITPTTPTTPTTPSAPSASPPSAPVRPAAGPGAPTSFTASLLGPYLDLRPVVHGSLQTQGLDCAYDQLAHPDEPLVLLQTHPAASFRPLVVRELRLPGYAEHLAVPADLDPALRTERWAAMVEAYDAYPGRPPAHQLRLLNLLDSLGLYEAIRRRAQPVTDEEIDSDASLAAIAARRVKAAAKVVPGDATVDEDLRVLARLAASPAVGPEGRMAAAITLVVQHSKGRRRDPALARSWREVAEREFAQMRIESWNDLLVASTYWRSVSFVPFQEGDRATVVAELDRAEELARAAPADDEVQRVIRGQNLHPLLETRVKEAAWLGDEDLALERARELVAIDPLDPKVHLQLGERLLRRGDVAAAAATYADAAHLGAPYTPLAWHAAGRCLEELDRLDDACEAYVLALRADPGGVSAAQRLVEIGRRAGYPELSGWALALLHEHRRHLRTVKEASGR